MSGEGILSSEDILRRVAGLVARYCGVVIAPEKDYLLTSRLRTLAKEHGHASIEAFYWAEVARRIGNGIVEQIVDAIVIGETTFFRDPPTFAFLAHELQERQRRVAAAPLAVWSAACATGQEPYSIAIQAHRAAPSLAREMRLLATDIARPFLRRAAEGTYRLQGLRGVTPQEMRPFACEREGMLEIHPSIREAVTFRRHNLLHGYEPLGRFDVIFCRNVLIYFDEPTRLSVLRRLGEALSPGGLLFLGLTECVLTFPRTLEKVYHENAVAFRRVVREP
jgi:chemotaxis protein methyltransferase CheR